MKVKELIDQLKTFDQDAEIMVHHEYRAYQAYRTLCTLQEYLYDRISIQKEMTVEECRKQFSQAYDICCVAQSAIRKLLKMSP